MKRFFKHLLGSLLGITIGLAITGLFLHVLWLAGIIGP